MTERRSRGEGSIDPRGPDMWRLRYWVDAAGRRKKKVGRRTLERYQELLKHHFVPTLTTRPLQKIIVTKEFQDRAEKLGFSRLRLHDLRGTHETLRLDAGMPVLVVAERCGHDAAQRRETHAQGRRPGGRGHWRTVERVAARLNWPLRPVWVQDGPGSQDILVGWPAK